MIDSHVSAGGLLSHGTVDCNDLAATRTFYEDFLGLDVIQPLPMAIYASGGGDWVLVCVKTTARLKEHGPENRFCLHLESADAVRKGHEAAQSGAERFAIRDVSDLSEDGRDIRFMIRDLNHTWWEISSRARLPL